MSNALYHQAILDLARRGARIGRLEAPDATATLDNPLCGDRVTLDLSLADSRVGAVGHRTRGCVLCQAAATVIAERAPGASVDDLQTLASELGEALRVRPADLGRSWPELAAFAPVHDHKSRHECVLLPFEALQAALAAAP